MDSYTIYYDGFIIFMCALIAIIIYGIINAMVVLRGRYMGSDRRQSTLKKDDWFYPKEGRKSFDSFYKFSNVKPFKKKITRNEITGYEDKNAFNNDTFIFRYPSKNAEHGADYVGTSGSIYLQENIPQFEEDVLTREQVEETTKKNYNEIELVDNVTFLDIDKFLSKGLM